MEPKVFADLTKNRKQRLAVHLEQQAIPNGIHLRRKSRFPWGGISRCKETLLVEFA